MESYAERLAKAERHVTEGRATVERQRELVREQAERGLSTKASQQVLDQFERTQTIFEEDMARLVARRSP